MKIEIWSDIMCPFCYIGKRKLELALEKFKYKDNVEISWHSFLLQPNLQYEKGKTIYDYLVASKGLQYEQAIELTQYVTKMANEVGLDFHFDKIVVANSFDAHRFTHFAAKKGLQHQAEEKLFKAYFVEGKNIGDHEVLYEIGIALGFETDEVKEMLVTDGYAQEVIRDVKEAKNLNIRGVPFFIFNRRYGLSGAQPEHVFLEVLEKAYEDEIQLVEVTSADNSTCDDGSCSV